MSHKFGGAVYAERNFGRFPASENVISAPASPILSLMMNEIVKIRKEHWDRINKENSRLSCENSALRIRIDALADVADSFLKYRSNPVELASQISMALASVSEEQPPDTCPECHGTGKTVINKHIGVEDCPECGRDSEEQTRIRFDTYSCGCKYPGGATDRTFEIPCPGCYEASGGLAPE